MKRRLFIVLGIASLACAFFLGTRFSHNDPEIDDPVITQSVKAETDLNIRTEWALDGTRSFWLRSEDKTLIEQYLFSSSNALIGRKIFRLNPDGDPMGGKIYDHANTEVYKIRYGYSKPDGMLVEEQVCDAKIKRISEITGNEIPLRRFLHTQLHGNKEPQITVVDVENADVTNPLVTPFRNPFSSR